MKRITILLLAFAGMLPAPVIAQQKIDIPDLIKETQMQAADPHSMSLVWWIPLEFWQANFAANSAVSAEQAQQMLSVLRPYLLIAAVDGKIGPMGGVTYKPEETLRSGIKVIDMKGRSYTPLAEDQVSADARNFVQMMRPVLSNILGPMGENMRFFLFPAVDGSGTEIANPTSQNHFAVKLGDNEFRWRLPLGSLLPPKACPDDGQMLNGAWSYCPWHGTKLKPQAAPAPGAPGNR